MSSRRERGGVRGYKLSIGPSPLTPPLSTVGRGSRPSSRHVLQITSRQAVSMAEIASETETPSSTISRKATIYGWRLALAAAIILFWEYQARTLGPLFFAPPLDVLKRIGTLAMSGQMLTDIAATM